MPSNHLLALDIGDKRVGVALASVEAKIAHPLVTLTNDQDLITSIQKLIDEYQVSVMVVGIPRNLNGEDSAQTVKVRHTIEQLTPRLNVEIATQDEALSSVRAEEQLGDHGKIFAKTDVDKLAAALILEDYIAGLKT